MLVTCPQCSKTLKVPDTVAGKKIRCPSCSAIVDAPPTGTSPKAPTSAPAMAPPSAPRVARPVKSGGSSSADSAPPVARNTTADRSRPADRQSSTRDRGGSERRPPSRSGAAGSRSESRPPAGRGRRKPSRSEEVEDYEEEGGYDDFGYGSGGDDGYEANPFAAPRTRTSHSSSRADERTGKSLTGIGLLIQGWSFVYVFVSMLGAAAVVFLTTMISGPGGRPPEALAALLGIAMLGNLVAGIAILVGQCLCLGIPGRSGAKGWIIGSLVCLVVMVVTFLSLGFSANMFSAALRSEGIRMLANFVVWVWLLTWLAYLICYQMFLRKASIYVGRDDLAQQALIVLIGVPSTMVIQFVFALLLGLLAPFLGFAAGIMLLVLAIVGLIANVVFAVMQVALLFRLGSAMRA